MQGRSRPSRHFSALYREHGDAGHCPDAAATGLADFGEEKANPLTAAEAIDLPADTALETLEPGYDLDQRLAPESSDATHFRHALRQRGDGPDRERLAAGCPDCHFLGYKFGRYLAQHQAGADVFVFPGRTDTVGIVMLEATACGLPVAAFPVTGPIDVVLPDETGTLDNDLRSACLHALEPDPAFCRACAETRNRTHSTQQFAGHLAPRQGTDLP